MQHGVVAATLELVPVAEVVRLPADARQALFSSAELAYALDKSDPERRLAARLAAKRAAARLLGDGLEPREFEVRRDRSGPPRLQLSSRAEERLKSMHADTVLVSLSHGREHAVASVLLLRTRP